jgi:GNAT superfamily N-acetyltransferase
MIDPTGVHYAHEQTLATAEFRRVLIESGLATHRPIEDDNRLGDMLGAANLILTARLQHPTGPLIGVARCITDFAWCCYISELAVSASAQGLGIGAGLLAEARRQLGPGVSIILISYPEAAGFYEHAGMERVPDVFWYRRER